MTIRVFETDVNQIPGGSNLGNGGWVSGSPASLAASGSVTAVFDLGANWQEIQEMAFTVFPVGPSTGFSNVLTTFSDTIVANSARRPPVKGASTAFNAIFSASLTTANGASGCYVMPMGRYFTVAITNADGANPLGATSKVVVATRT